MPHCSQCLRSFRSPQALRQHAESTSHTSELEGDNSEDSVDESPRRPRQPQAKATVHKPSFSPSSPIDRFFESFGSFDYEPSQPPSKEWRRLNRIMGWDRGDADGTDAWERYRAALTAEFDSWYGTDDRSLEAWQRLCRVVGIQPLPESRKACRKALRGVHVNLVDLVQNARNKNFKVERFPSLTQLRKYTTSTGKYFPKNQLKSGALLKQLLREIFV